MKKNKMKFKLRKENHKKMPDKKQRKANMQKYLDERMQKIGYNLQTLKPYLSLFSNLRRGSFGGMKKKSNKLFVNIARHILATYWEL